MKKLYYSLMGASMMLMAFTSCTLDEPEDYNVESAGTLEIPELAEPKYEAQSALYDITSEDSEYSTIEFTASGNYVVTEKGYYDWHLPAEKAEKKDLAEMVSVKSLHKTTVDFTRCEKVMAATRASYFNGRYYGDFTMIGENKYYLNGFGTVTVNFEDGNACEIIVDRGNGAVKMGAVRQENYSNSERTNAICRTWNVNSIQIQIYQYNLKLLDETFTASNWDENDESADGWPGQIIFTKAGSYMVIYGLGDDQELDISSWKWGNEAKGILRYSWNLESINDPEASGMVRCLFNGKQLTIEEVQSEGSAKIRMVYYMTQAE